MSKLAGKTALVTGASGGIGRAIAERLAADGAVVAVHYGRSHQDSRGDQAGRRPRLHRRSRARRGRGRRHAVRRAEGRPGRAPAGHPGQQRRRRPGDRLDRRDDARGIRPVDRAQQRAPFFIIQRALPLLRDGGRNINISSADTRIAITRELAYSMAKGAINVLSRTLAHAVGERGITVNTVAPGITDTERNAWIYTGPEMEARTASASALNRIGQPSDIADIVAFLASDDARWITGDLNDATGGTFPGPRI